MLAESHRELLNQVEAHGDDETCEECIGHHAADYYRAKYPSSCRARSGRDPQRHAPEDEGKRGHKERTAAEPCSLQRRIHKIASLFEFDLGELNDHDCVLCRQSYQNEILIVEFAKVELEKG